MNLCAQEDDIDPEAKAFHHRCVSFNERAVDITRSCHLEHCEAEVG